MSSISPALLAERRQALHRVLRGLPDRFLTALVEGVEEADVVVSGRLFAGDSGGCLVGITLRTFHPQLRRRRLPARARRSVSGLRRSLAQRVPHLRTLEEVFDRSVSLAEARHPDVAGCELARGIADWMAAEAQRELLRRELDADWLTAAAEQREREAQEELERELAALEPQLERELVELVHDWSLPA